MLTGTGREEERKIKEREEINQSISLVQQMFQITFELHALLSLINERKTDRKKENARKRYRVRKVQRKRSDKYVDG